MNKTTITILTGVSCLIIGFFVGMEYKAYQIRSTIQDTTEEMVDVFNTQQPVQETPSQERSVTYVDSNIGELVELATINFTVKSAAEKQTLSGTFGSPAIAKENAKFVVVDMNIVNTTDADFTFFPDDGFRLVDGKGRQFSTYNDTIGKVQNYLNVRELAPGITESGVVVFEVPTDAMSYALTVGKGGTSEVHRVILK